MPFLAILWTRWHLLNCWQLLVGRRASTPKVLLLLPGWILILVAGVHITNVRADDQLPYDSANLDDRLARLIKELDDPSYITRETASEKLAAIGAPALRPLAMKAVSGSPESMWRVKHALESIGTQGDEELFYQAIGILQLLYLDGSESLNGRIAQLQRQWKLEQKKNAIMRLRKLGATVNDPLEDQIVMPNQFDNFQQQVIVNNMILEQVRPDQIFEMGSRQLSLPPPAVARTIAPPANLDPDDASREIDKILLASLAENREKVLASSGDLSANVNQASGDLDPEQLELKLRIAALQRRNELNVGLNRGIGISVELSERWHGTMADLQELRNLPGLNRIELNHFRPEADQLAELVQLNSVSTFKISGPEIPTREWKRLNDLQQLRELEIGDREITVELVQQFSGSKSLSHITFSSCEIKPAAIDELAEHPLLRSIFFSDMQIDESIFASLTNLKDLNYVNLSTCKFQTKAYRRFESERPNLQIVFTPQAFLGVRGPRNFDDLGGCEISEVVAGSGAEKGGVLIGDIIEKIDGQSIARFEDLRLHIAQHKAGEIITVGVRREGKPVDLKIELTRYDSNLQ